MHRGVHRWKRAAKTNMLSNRFIIYFVYEIGTPIPLQARRIQDIQQGLQGGLRQRTYKIECGLLESADRLKSFLRCRLRPAICPTVAAHFFHVTTLWERLDSGHSEKTKD